MNIPLTPAKPGPRRPSVTSLLGSRPISWGFSRFIPGLRVLAFHGVPDAEIFRLHIADLLRHYRPIGADQIHAAVNGDVRLPKKAVWVTFDDGHPSTFDVSRDLAEVGISATVFVCPGVIGTREPLWWQVVDEAIRRHAVPAALEAGDLSRFRASLKTVDDDARRSAVEACRANLEAVSTSPFQVEQATVNDLHAWIGDGHHVGNHTWDHPLLDRCTPDEQVRQVRAAHDWLRERFPGQPLVFAYPNGNYAAYAETAAAGLGYDVRTLFDHRVARKLAADSPMSRLRIDADADPARLRAVASGGHSLAFAMRRRRSAET